MNEPVVLKVIGLTSGITVDSIDAALVEIAGTGPEAEIRLLEHRCYPYAAKMRQAVLDTSINAADYLSSMNFVLGEMLAAAAYDLARDCGFDLADVDLIASHGQTVWHSPERMEVGGMWTASTLQIGEPSVIADRTGITTVADFRTADMAAGGQGAPLLPYVDYILFQSMIKTRAVQNIGGIGSVTYIPAGARLDKVTGFDTGPGIILMDAVVEKLTDGKLAQDGAGKLAESGTPDRFLLGRLMNHPFLQKQPPRSVESGDFGQVLAGQLLAEYPDVPVENMAATVTAFVAQSIKKSYERWLPKMPDEVILGGRGAANSVLVRMLTEALPKSKVYTHEAFNLDSSAKEALAFAVLGSETIRLQPSNVPSATGAKHPVILGKVTPGRNYRDLLAKLMGTLQDRQDG